jgi:hypothetical protein
MASPATSSIDGHSTRPSSHRTCPHSRGTMEPERVHHQKTMQESCRPILKKNGQIWEVLEGVTYPLQCGECGGKEPTAGMHGVKAKNR